MKKLLSIVGGMAAVALLLALPAQSEIMKIADSELDMISGKAGHPINTFDVGGTISDVQVATGDNNTQVGWYQWHDKHGGATVKQQSDGNFVGISAPGDQSDHKGANDQGGSASVVQQNVAATTNAINWIVWVTWVETYGDVVGDFTADAGASGSLFLGGF